MIYCLWYKFKGPDAPWLARGFPEDRTRGQFIARHKKGLAEWAINDVNVPHAILTPVIGHEAADAPPPGHLKIHRNP